MENLKYEISLLKFTNEDLAGLSVRVEQLENKILDRLKQQYKSYKQNYNNGRTILKEYTEYQAMRLFCLDCELVSFNDIELMEFEVNQSLS